MVACSKTKAAAARPAAQLYASPLFLYSYRAAVRTCDRVVILSALYGVVEPDEVLSPYDLALMDLTPAGRREWGEVVAERIKKLLRGRGPHRLVFFAGRGYETSVAAVAGTERVTPLQGLFIGQRIRACQAMQDDAFRVVAA
jgi:cytoplasmic iron level regulating protein YaaA (DUF328/UPF0246 family)